MARTTCDVENGYIGATRSNWYAIVTDTDCRGSDIDIGGVANVDAISIRAVPWSSYADTMDDDVVTAEYAHMESLAVQQRDVADTSIWNIHKS